MFSTAHLTSGLVLGLALGLDGWPLAILVLASVFTDWDYAIQLATGVNHRRRLTHSPPVVAVAIALVALVFPLAWWALAGSMLHLALDMTDYGVRLNPFSKRIVGLRLLRVSDVASFGQYITTYFRDPKFLTAEIVLAGVAVALVIVRLV